jgi:ribosomal protein L11 methyltransferase
MQVLQSQSSPKMCYELIIQVQKKEKDALIEMLQDLGESSFVEGAVDFELEFDFDPSADQEDCYNQMSGNAPIIIYSEDAAHLQRLQKQVMEYSPRYFIDISEQSLVCRPIMDQNWRESWKASFKPIHIFGPKLGLNGALSSVSFSVVPPWEKDHDFGTTHQIVIDPGMAFGTGQHETTRLCLEILLTLNPPKNVFDVGTGSGILAIAAHKLGAAYIAGNDIDLPSLEVAERNAEENGTPGILFTSLPISEVVTPELDVVFANIQIKPLQNIMGSILKKCSAKTKIIVSGILATELPEFSEFMHAIGVAIIQTYTQGAWTGLLCERNKHSVE